MSLEEGKILSSDVNDLISRIDAEIKRRNKCGSSDFWDSTVNRYEYNITPCSDWGTDN